MIATHRCSAARASFASGPYRAKTLSSRTISAEACTSSLLRASKVLFAEAINRPRTKADIRRDQRDPEIDDNPGIHAQMHGMVGKEAPDYLLKPLPLLGNGMVSSLAQLLLDFPKFRTAAVASGLPFKLENSPAGFAADQCETQKVEGLRLADAPRCSRLCTA